MRLVYMPGVWDLLHVGHVCALERARSYGDRLIVGVPDDATVLADKGQLPVIPLEQRMRMLSALRAVDVVASYHSLCFLRHLETYRPEVLAVSTTWGRQERHIAAERWIHERGGKVVRVPYMAGVSSTSIKHSICEAFCNGCDAYQKQLFGRSRTDDRARGASVDGSTGHEAEGKVSGGRDTDSRDESLRQDVL